MTAYPAAATARERFILDRRSGKPAHDPWRTPATSLEFERAADGSTPLVATIFLTGRECPWHCVMCDLWRYTIDGDTPSGAITSQIASALGTGGPRPDVVKLYNAGSFFDPRAVPSADYPAVVATLAGISRLVVESHPSLVGPATEHLHALAANGGIDLEVAMGLETIHPDALDRLNKRMTSLDFVRAADRLHALGVSVRAFLLVSPPFIAPAEQDEWLVRSVDYALACGVEVVSLIPTRGGNGAMEDLEADGDFVAPCLADLERSLSLALARRRFSSARVFADLWDLARFSSCSHCLEARRSRLHHMNLAQHDSPAIGCQHCGAA